MEQHSHLVDSKLDLIIQVPRIPSSHLSDTCCSVLSHTPLMYAVRYCDTSYAYTPVLFFHTCAVY
eukprot:504508-Rhodomonas_salina.5